MWEEASAPLLSLWPSAQGLFIFRAVLFSSVFSPLSPGFQPRGLPPVLVRRLCALLGLRVSAYLPTAFYQARSCG